MGRFVKTLIESLIGGNWRGDFLVSDLLFALQAVSFINDEGTISNCFSFTDRWAWLDGGAGE